MTALDWQLPLLQASLRAIDPAFVVEVAEVMDSSSSELMRRVRGGLQAPTLLVAQTQTAGRGRLGRQWHSATPERAGDSLTFSLALPMPLRDLSGLSLAVGACLAQHLDPNEALSGGPRIGLKWPNDLWWQGRKLAGILVETVASGVGTFVVVGVGVNIVAPVADAVRPFAAGLAQIQPGTSAPQALRRLAAPLVLVLRRFAQAGFPAFKSDFEARDVLFGREVMGLSSTDDEASPAWVGQACGVDASGALLVHTVHGMQRITSSEVKIRPAAAAAPPPAGL
jgi:BirA family biotin operon repressor/biotin-[acetyl-CoA-carboxylase] ligase